MKLQTLGMAAVGGLFALSLAGCAPQTVTETVPLVDQAPSEQAVQQAENEGPAAEQAAVDAQANAQSAQTDQAAEAAQATEDTQAAEDTQATEATAEQEAASPAALQIVDSGWFAADNGMVDFAVEIQNPNHTVEAVDPVIEVVGKDDAGNVLFDETIETPGILPDSTYYYSYVAGLSSASVGPDEQVVKPATVDFTVTTPKDSWKATDEKLTDVYAVQDNGAATSDFGTQEFKGTVTASEQLDGADQSRVDVVLLDKDGHIEGGYFKIVDTEPGQAADYDIYAVGAPEYASYAVYASPWSDDSDAAATTK